MAYVNDGIGEMIANAFPTIRHTIEGVIDRAGNTVALLTGYSPSSPGLNTWRSIPYLGEFDDIAPYHLVNFPVKPGYVYPLQEGLAALDPKYLNQAKSDHRLPGYMSKARVSIVEESVKELYTLVDETDWSVIAVPRFKEIEVNEYLHKVLDDRFLLVWQ